MNWIELFLNYGISIFVLVSVILTALIFYKVGYLYGHQDGWRQGVYRGQAFGRLKLHEDTFPDHPGQGNVRRTKM